MTNQPQMHPANLVFSPQEPCEYAAILLWGTVLYDQEDGLFKIWYMTWGNQVGLVLGAAVLAIANEAAVPTLESLTQKFETGRPVTLATFGDSITWPCFHTDGRQNYITLAAEALRQAYPMANIAIVHAGNMGTAERGLAEQRFEKHVLSFNPDAVFLMFGMNDCVGGMAGLDAYDRNLTALIGKARQAGALPIICTQNEIIYDSPDGAGRKALPQYMQRALEVAAREKARAVDCFARWQPLLADGRSLASRLNDWIHPNLAGHRWLAKSILESLWPRAAANLADGVRTPEDAKAPPPVACLLPGPPGKQIVRVEDGTWIALTGRRRGGWITELVFSWAREERPSWSDFRHVTLIGSGPQAVFDHQDRTLTAGLLLERPGRIDVVFSWNIGVFFLSLDPTHPDWTKRAEQPGSWLEHTGEPFVRPTAILHHAKGGGLLHDAFESPGGWPAVLCSHFKMAPGAGWEVVEGEDGVALATWAPGQDAAMQFFHTAAPLTQGHTPLLAYRSRSGQAQREIAILRERAGRLEFSVFQLSK
ncbi:MAG: hypothetical protein HY717_00490 [Planctomycetes bacterium]|nr:hypothetical protein [Planctomycetota bacterium]